MSLPLSDQGTGWPLCRSGDAVDSLRRAGGEWCWPQRLAYLEVTSGRGHHPGRVGSRCPDSRSASSPRRAAALAACRRALRLGRERGCHTGESELARPFRGTLRVPFGRRRSDRPLKLPRHRDELAQRVLEIGKVWCLQEGPIERS